MKNTHYISLFAVPIIMVLFVSCSTQIKYLGNTYQPTEDVKIYFNEADITDNHEVMGRIYVKFKETKNIESIQNRIMAKVRSVGGDAVLMGEMNEEVTGSKTGSTGASTRVGKKKGTRIGTSVSKTSMEYKDEIECQVMKYKK